MKRWERSARSRLQVPIPSANINMQRRPSRPPGGELGIRAFRGRRQLSAQPLSVERIQSTRVATQERRCCVPRERLSASHFQSKPAGEFDRPVHRVQEGAHDDHDQPSERINPIFCMKSGKIDLHVLASLLSVEETTAEQPQAARAQRETGGRSRHSKPAMGSAGQPTDIGEPTRTG